MIYQDLKKIGNLKLDRYSLFVIRMTNNEQLVIRYSNKE